MPEKKKGKLDKISRELKSSPLNEICTYANLFSLILKDLSVHRISLNSLHDLDYLRNIAQDRAQWRRMQYA